VSFALVVSLCIASPPTDSLPSWVHADSAARTVTLELAAVPGDSGPTLNGHRRGDLQLVVPLNWTVRWIWVNRDTAALHSLEVMAEREKLPLQGGPAALDNAMSRSVITGLKPGQQDLTSFVADQAGWYWVLCGVSGHALAGEWIGLKIDREATGVEVIAKT
jgi:hypothetical protein